MSENIQSWSMRQISFFFKTNLDTNRVKVQVQYTKYVCARRNMHVDELQE